MGLFSRFTCIIEAKLSMLLDGIDNPGEALDYSYRRQLELDQKVKRGIAGVVVARKRLEMQKGLLEDRLARLDRDSRSAIAAGREDLAEIAVRRKVQLAGVLESLDGEIASLQTEQSRLVGMGRLLEMKIESFCLQKEAIKARYSAARAKVWVQEATSGLDAEMGHVGHAVRMVHNRTRALQARSEALDELACCGALDDIPGNSDVVDRELSRVRSDEAIKTEMEKLRTDIGR